MATKVVLPLLGQTMEEGTITKWLKNEGETVEKGEPLLEVMTDKANMEVEAPATGIVRKIVAAEGAIVPVKDLLAIIGTADESIDEFLAPAASAAAAVAVTAAPSVASSATAVKAAAETVSDRLFVSPRAKKLAAEQGIDINLLSGKGTGPEGRIVEQDVLAFSQTIKPIAPVRATSLAGKLASEMGVDLSGVPGTGPRGKVTRDDVLSLSRRPSRPSIGKTIPVIGMRKIIADNISHSIRTAPHVTLVTEVDMTACSTMRKQLLPEFEKRYGVKLTITGIIAKAAAMAIVDHPIINSSFFEDKIVIHDEINVGVAAAVEGGLVVPVIKDIDRKPLYQISEELSLLAAKARSGSLALDEMQGGTFTISNLGSYGVDSFNPVINPPESAILGVCRSVQKPVVVDGQVTVRQMMNLCLSFDHRVMDGAPAGAYLSRVKELLEQPYLLLV